MNMTIKDTASILLKPYIKKILRYKNIHKGDSCYIIGDGISIKWYDLSLFSDLISIPLSLIPFHNDFYKLNSRYCILSEPYWFYPYFKLPKPYGYYWKNLHQIEYRKIIKANSDIDYFINASNIPVLSGKNLTFIFNKIYDSSLASDYISNVITPFAGSFRTAITLAIYMGFKKVYLIGCDYTHNPSMSLHWYEKGEGVLGNSVSYQEDYLKLAKQYVDITTISTNGRTNTSLIKSISYQDYTGKQMHFRENNELMSRKILKILDTWPGYKIY